MPSPRRSGRTWRSLTSRSWRCPGSPGTASSRRRYGRASEAPGQRRRGSEALVAVAAGAAPDTGAAPGHLAGPASAPRASGRSSLRRPSCSSASSTRMNDPVWRFCRYGSTNSGCVTRSCTRPISFSASSVDGLVAVQRVDVDPVVELADDRPRPSRRVLDPVLARPSGAPRSRPSSTPGRRCPATRVGMLCGRQSMSPREMSSSSVERDRDGHRREGLVDRAVGRVDRRRSSTRGRSAARRPGRPA